MHCTERSFHGIRLLPVYRALDVQTRREILALWQGVLPPEEAARRLDEVYLAIRHPDDRLIGVTSVHEQGFRRSDERYWFLRMYVDPTARGTFGLGRRASSMTRDCLLQYPPEGSRAEGVIVVTENPKLWRPGMHRVFWQEGWRFYGRGPRGNEIWYLRRDGQLLAPPGPS
jgi:hypothetical protein